MIEDTLRNHVKEWCKTAMVTVLPGKDGFAPPAQPEFFAWTITPIEFESFLSYPEAEIPQVSFCLMRKPDEFKLAKSPEALVEVLYNRFRCALLDLWELGFREERRKNIERMCKDA